MGRPETLQEGGLSVFQNVLAFSCALFAVASSSAGMCLI